MKQTYLICLLIVLLLYCVYTDEREGKIKNLAVLAMLAIEISHIIIYPFYFINFFKGLFLPLLILVIPFLFHGIGAGDIKLLMVIGGIAGSKRILTIIFSAFVIGVIRALIDKLRKRHNPKIHMALPIAISTLMWIGGII